MVEVIERLPFEEYIKLPGEHSSGFRDMLESPLLYKHRQTSKRPDTDTLRVGRAGHTATLEIARFLLEYALYDGRRVDAKWKAFQEMHAGKTILKPEQYKTAIAVSEAIRRHPIARQLLEEDGRNELTVTWTDERTGLPCKARFDRLCSALVDLKLTFDPSPRRFAATAANFDYATQMATYREAERVAGLGEHPVIIIAAQSRQPHDVVVFEMDEEMVRLGDARRRMAMDRIVECRKTNKWPGVAPDETQLLELPPWMSVLDDEPITFGEEAIG